MKFFKFAENAGSNSFNQTTPHQACLAYFIACMVHEHHEHSNEKSSAPLLVLIKSENEAMRLQKDLIAFRLTAETFPAKDFDFLGADTKSNEYEQRRLEVLAKISSGELQVVIATPESASQITFTQSTLNERMLTINKDEELELDTFIEKLTENGYIRVPLIDGVAQFSIRGSIVDVFPLGSQNPIRIDLWGNTVESLFQFDLESQRRVAKIDSTRIPPAVQGDKNSEHSTIFDFVRQIVVYEHELCYKQFKSAYEQLLLDLEAKQERASERTGFARPMEVSSTIANSSSSFGDGRAAPPALAFAKLMLTEAEYCALVESKQVAEFSDTEVYPTPDGQSPRRAGYRRDTPLQTGKARLAGDTLVLPWNGDYRKLKLDLEELIKQKFAIVLFAGNEKAAKSLALDLRDDGFACDYSESVLSAEGEVFAGHVFVTKGALSSGIKFPELKLGILTILSTGGSSDSGAGTATIRKAKKKSKAETIRALTDINVGDYIVHDNHGIGVFEGVTKLTSDGASRDYIKLKYAGKDVLYLPVTQLDFIARYIGNIETASLKLSKLNTDTWFKTKAKVKKAVSELADELIELYYKRMRAKGYKFSKDTPEQLTFEASFPHIETRDQLICIDEIKSDMQSHRPMDRLLCGDVGFGKTEVALRAVFKCIMDGKQCALLCPTTVLAWQHFQTALSRMNRKNLSDSSLTVNIELLSRFRTAKQQNEIKKKLESGIVDFVIGTHTLVSDSVKFKNLGLVIIDEEQRFGVNQKEKFKEAFAGVDVLTLSATPIPRTLNMAMSGIRDMSVIETPPHDRIPISTYVIRHDFSIITSAINKELRRAGQVYYIHNRVDTITNCAAKLAELVPSARIGIAHGRMGEKELLSVWQQLLYHEIDILVCTTLIETGIDVPNVNTLIIENADKMGLAQLHQLRGRVGRTNRRAYAYLTFPPMKELSEIADKRLKAVREFAEFGAGVKIALRDLEIRGAGSVLGESQSGHLSTVGYETYVRLLEQAVDERKAKQELKGELRRRDSHSKTAKPSLREDTLVLRSATIDIKTDAFIPESYITNQTQRIAFYKKIAEIRDDESLLDMEAELLDRYGSVGQSRSLPKPVQGLLNVTRIRNRASKLGISEIVHNAKEQKLVLYWENPDMEHLSNLPPAHGKRMELNLTGRVGVTFKLGKLMFRDKHWQEFDAVDDVLSFVMNIVDGN